MRKFIIHEERDHGLLRDRTWFVSCMQLEATRKLAVLLQSSTLVTESK